VRACVCVWGGGGGGGGAHGAKEIISRALTVVICATT
jgi:hypothetical protein